MRGLHRGLAASSQSPATKGTKRTWSGFKRLWLYPTPRPKLPRGTRQELQRDVLRLCSGPPAHSRLLRGSCPSCPSPPGAPRPWPAQRPPTSCHFRAMSPTQEAGPVPSECRRRACPLGSRPCSGGEEPWDPRLQPTLHLPSACGIYERRCHAPHWPTAGPSLGRW